MSEFDSSLDQSPVYEILGGIYIQMLRIYDLLGLMLKDNPKFEDLVSLHESGRVLSPPPALVMDDEE